MYRFKHPRGVFFHRKLSISGALGSLAADRQGVLLASFVLVPEDQYTFVSWAVSSLGVLSAVAQTFSYDNRRGKGEPSFVPVVELVPQRFA